MSGYDFHAAPPAGEWFNDPNGLGYLDGAFRLFVQHASDAPDFAERGWARLSSSDLLRWRFDGPVLPADALGRRYSGSIVPRGGAVEAFLTLDDPQAEPRQRQVRTISRDAGATWGRLDPVGPAGRNVRDPFVWSDGEGTRRMLVAHPGAWEAAERGERSFLSQWTERPDGRFERTATIGPWHPPGVLWEVPALIDFGSVQTLLISLVNRRGGATRCEVRYWLGRTDERGFSIQRGFPQGGRLLDCGPDFYAAIPNAPEGWPDPGRVVVAWAADWGRAGQTLPGGGHGGAITLPRLILPSDHSLYCSPLPAAVPLAHRTWTWGAGQPGGVSIVSTAGRWDFSIAGERVQVEHEGVSRRIRLPSQPGGRVATLFYDRELIELFIAGIAFTLRGALIDASAR